MTKQQGNALTLLVAVVVVFIGLYVYFGSLGPMPGSSQDVSTSTTVSPPESYGGRGTDASWPKMPTDSVVTADNLLAKNYMFVLDASGSMDDSDCTDKPNKLAEAKAAIRAFGESLPADANLGMIVFNGPHIWTALDIGPFDARRLDEALEPIRPTGSTPLADAMRTGYAHLTAQAIRQLGNGQYNLVVVTDGEADSGQDVLGMVNYIVQTSPIMIHAVGFCIGSRHALNQKGMTRYVAASDGASLRQGLAAVLAESPTFDVSAFEAVH